MTAAIVQPPLFIGEDYAYDFFESVEAALRYVEPWFPDAVPDYRAYDSAGHRLRMVVTTGGARGAGRREELRLEVVQAPDTTDEAAHLLRAFLHASGSESDTESDYPALLSAAIARAGFTR